MKKLKSWLALILAVVLVASNAIYSMGSSLKADELNEAPTVTEADTNADAPVIENEGVDLAVVDQPAEQPQVTPPEPAAADPVAPEPSVNEPAQPEQPAVEEQPQAAVFNVTIKAPDIAEAGTVKVQKPDGMQAIDSAADYVEADVQQGSAFIFMLIPQTGYHVDSVKANDINIEAKEVTDEGSTYELSDIKEAKEIVVTWAQDEKQEDSEETNETEAVESDQSKAARSATLPVIGTESSVEIVSGADNQTMDVGGNIVLRCSDNDKKHEHDWHHSTAYFTCKGDSDKETITLTAKQETIAGPTNISCGEAAGVGVTIISKDMIEQTAYFYILKPGADSEHYQNHSWYNAGTGRVKAPALNTQNVGTRYYRFADMIIEEPDAYPDITGTDGEIYRYSDKGEYGTYSLKWDRIVVSDGANPGINKGPTVPNGTKTYHVDAFAEFHNKQDSTVSFLVKEAGAPSFTTTDKLLPYTVKNGTEESDLKQPNMPGTQIDDGIKYTFNGWYTDEACSNKAKFDGVVDDNVTYYGKYVASQYKVTYYYSPQDKDVFTTDPIRYDEGEMVNIIEANPDKHDEDKMFIGWVRDPELIKNNQGVVANEDQYKAVAPYLLNYPQQFQMGNENASLYAVFAKGKAIPSITINYNVGSAGGGTVTTSSEAIGNPYIGPVEGSTAKAQAGWKFVNWTDASGKAVSVKAQFKPEKSKETGRYENATYTANFEKQKYTITYNLNGGTVNSNNPNPTSYSVDSKTIVLNNPTKPGYDFLGWSGTEITDKSSQVIIDTGSIGDRVYTANWKGEPRTVQYELENTEDPSIVANFEAHKKNVGESVDIKTVNSPERPGYIFLGWKIQTASIDVKDEKFTMPNSDVRIRGRYKVDDSQKFDYTVKHVFPEATNEKFDEIETKPGLNASTEITAKVKPVPGYKVTDVELDPIEAWVPVSARFDKNKNFVGFMPGMDFTLTYIYSVDTSKMFNFDVSYMGPNGEISEPDKATFNAEAKITAAPKEIDGYKVVGATVEQDELKLGFKDYNFSGIMPNEDVHITYTYAPDTAKTYAYNVKYVGPNDKPLSPAEVEQQVSAETDITAVPKAIDGYVLDKAEVNVDKLQKNFDGDKKFSAKMPNKAVTVTYRYKTDGQTEFNLNIEYKSSSGKTLLDPKVEAKKTEDIISVKPETIPGYEVITADITADTGISQSGYDFIGTMPNKAVTITYTYGVNRQEAFKLNVEYKGTDGEDLRQATSSKKLAEASISVSPETIPGYMVTGAKVTPDIADFSDEFKLVDAVMPNKDVTVTYTYAVDPSATFNYDVNYTFPMNPELDSSEPTKKVNAEADIIAVPKLVAGYKVKEVKTAPTALGSIDLNNMFTGKMPNRAASVTYIYEVDTNVIFKYDVSHEVPGNPFLSSSETTDVNAEQAVTAAPKVIDGYVVDTATVTPDGTGSFEAGNVFNAKMPNRDVHVTYTYTPDVQKTFAYNVEYVVPGNDALSSRQDEQQISAEGQITAAPRQIDGYELDKAEVKAEASKVELEKGFDADKNFTGNMPNEAVTITYTYKVDKTAEYAYNVEYQVPGNPALSSSEETKNLNAESEIKAAPKDILGYVVSKAEVTDNLGSFDADNKFSAKMPNKAVTVTYTYEPDRQKTFAYNVEYKVPGNSALSGREETQKLNAEQDITAQPREIAGYRVSTASVNPESAGTFADNSFSGKMLNQAVTVTYTYEPDTNVAFNYDVTYDVPGNPELSSAEATAAVSAEGDITAAPRTIEGYKLSKVEVTPQGLGSFDADNAFSAKMPNGDVRVTYTYVPDSESTFAYSVKYVVTGNEDLNQEEPVQNLSAESSITAGPRVIAGYKVDKAEVTPAKTGTFDADNKFSGTMSNKAVEVVYTYVVDESQKLPYTVNYYQDDVIMDSVQNEALVASPIVDSVSYDNMPTGYMLDEEQSTILPYTVGDNDNTINVYYTKDSIGEGDNPEEGDGIPDKYQTVVDYRAVNGTVSFEKTVVTLKDADGNPAANGTGTLERVAEAQAAQGYDQNSLTWTPAAPEKGMEIKEAVTFTASFTATEAGTNPPAPGTPATPATPGAPGTPATPAAATPATPAAAIIATITQPLTALADTIGEALNANVEEIVPVDEDGVPLANKVSTDHKCCVLHVLLLLLAMLIEVLYTRGAKKRQKRIFELKEEIALADKELKQKEDQDKEIIA